MVTKHDDPFIYINFIDESGSMRHWQFKSPIEVIIARTLEEVKPCLSKVQYATEQGYYVAGFLSYEAAAAFHNGLNIHEGRDLPLLWFGVFNEPIDAPLQGDQPFTTSPWMPNVSKQTYNNRIDHILALIKEGKTEQVNYTIPFSSQFSGDPFTYYMQLKKAQAANYSAYLNIGHTSILSVSPELFFHLNKGVITTRPMKGTVARGKTYEEDTYLSEWLQTSVKNRHENKLIVDLMKRELETIAKKESVKTTQLYQTEKYPTVWQMTSTITGKLEDDQTLTNIFQALFPCGSITGQPKSSTMQLITELENKPRNIYCGTIGFMTPQQEAMFNVPIRTVTVDHTSGQATYHAGGAITEASTKAEEYEEVLTKTDVLTKKIAPFQLLESFGLKNGDYLVLDKHFKRLQASALYFDFNIRLTDIRETLRTYARNYSTGHWKIRLVVAKDGTFDVTIHPITPLEGRMRVSLAHTPINDDLFLYHKTTDRTIYDRHKVKCDTIFDTLLWNLNGEITEFTIGNIVVKLNGSYYTPPVSAGLLAGTYRATLLEQSIISERSITIDDLTNCTEIWFINSVREWVPVTLHGPPFH